MPEGGTGPYLWFYFYALSKWLACIGALMFTLVPAIPDISTDVTIQMSCEN
jgi:hypothetical protein